MSKGRLIVMDGPDGSGKATQVELLSVRLRGEGRRVEIVDFPEYQKNFFGALIGECLKDEDMRYVDVHPKIASVLYAADRWQSKEKIQQWLKEGVVVLANRYVSSSQIHQAARMKDDSKREEFLKWLEEMEYKHFGIPRPDAVVYLSLPVAIAKDLIVERSRKKDVYEADPEFLKASHDSALKLVNEVSDVIQIDCAPKGELLSKESVHELVHERLTADILK